MLPNSEEDTATGLDGSSVAPVIANNDDDASIMALSVCHTALKGAVVVVTNHQIALEGLAV